MKKTTEVKSAQIREENGRSYVWITGNQDGWSTGQVLCDVHEVSGVLVLMSPFNHRPMAVVADRGQLADWVQAKTGVRP